MLEYHCNTNDFLVKTIKDLGLSSLLQIYNQLLQLVATTGLKLRTWFFKSECSCELTDIIIHSDIKYHLVASYN